MFYPQLFGIVGEILVTTPSLQYDDPEDLFDDKQLLEVIDNGKHMCSNSL